MDLPSYMNPGKNRFIGLNCECEVNGVIRNAIIGRFPADLYTDRDHDALVALVEPDLRSSLAEPRLKLLKLWAIPSIDSRT